MAEIYNVVYPPQGRVTFDGGLNNKYPPAIIGDNESPDCLNVVFYNGAVETRGGSTQFNTTPVATAIIDGLYTRSDNSGVETMVAFCNGSMWQNNNVSTFVTVPSAQSVFTAGVRVGACNFLNKLFVGNGNVTPYKYDGTNFTAHGVNRPPAAVSAVTSATGNVPAGGWIYCYTWVNSAVVEGNVSPLTSTLTIAASSTVSLTSIAIAPQSFGVSSRNIYRASTTAGPFLRVGSIADNATTTFTDNVSSLGLGVAAPTDNGMPPKWSVAVQHQRRLWMNDTANPNYIWYSEIDTPDTVKSTNFQAFGDASLDLVRGLAVYNNSILVLCVQAMYLYYLPDATPADWVTIKLLSQYGSKSPFATFLYDNMLMVAAMQNNKFAGFAAVSNNSVVSETTKLATAIMGSDRTTDRVEPDMFQVPDGSTSTISSFVFKNKAYVALPFGTNQTTNNRVYLFDFSHSTISDTPYSWAPIASINAVQLCVYNTKLYYADSAVNGLISQLETTSYNDNGSAINSYFWTKEFSGVPGHENLQKDFRKCKLLVDKPGPYYMNLTYRTDSDKGQGTAVLVSIDPGSSVWNTLIWGAGNWGGGVNQQEITVPLGQTTGKRIQFQFSNQNAANQKFKVHGLNFTYNVKGTR